MRKVIVGAMLSMDGVMAVLPNGIIAAMYARGGEVKTATVGGALEPTPAELARREKLKREG